MTSEGISYFPPFADGQCKDGQFLVSCHLLPGDRTSTPRCFDWITNRTTRF